MLSSTGSHPARTAPAVLRWCCGGLAAAWYAVTTFGPLGLPNFAVVFVLGVLVVLSVEPDAALPTGASPRTRRNLVLALRRWSLRPGRLRHGPAARQDPDRGRACRPRHARRDLRGAAAPGRDPGVHHAGGARAPRADHRGHGARRRGRAHTRRARRCVAMVAFAVSCPSSWRSAGSVSAQCSPRLLGRRDLGAAGRELLALPAPAGRGQPSRHVLRRGVSTPPMPQAFIVGAFWVGLAAAALLVAFPRRRISATANVLAVLGSVFLVVQLVGTVSAPRDAVPIGVPLRPAGGRSSPAGGARWSTTTGRSPSSATRSTSSSLVDGKTSRGDRSRLENFFIFGQPLLAVADGRVTEAVDGHPDLPVGGTHLARHGGQPRDSRHRRRPLRPLRTPEAGQPARPRRRRRSGAVRWSARSATPATRASHTCTCRCRTSRPSTWRTAASAPTRSSSTARRSPMSAGGTRCGRWPERPDQPGREDVRRRTFSDAAAGRRRSRRSAGRRSRAGRHARSVRRSG